MAEPNEKKKIVALCVLVLLGISIVAIDLLPFRFSSLFSSLFKPKPAPPPPPPPAPPGPFDPRPLDLSFKEPVELASHPGAAMEELPSKRELLQVVDFDNPPEIESGAAASLNSVSGIISGESAAWLLTPAGIKVFEKEGKRWGLLTALTSDDVRAKEYFIDQAGGSAWFCGRALYRYDLSKNSVEALSPEEPFGAVKKMFPVPEGVWLGTEKGIFFFNDGTRTFAKLSHPDLPLDKGIVNGSINHDGGWLLNEDGLLLRLSFDGKGGVGLDAVQPLNRGTVRDMLSLGGRLWMTIHSADKDARLALLDPQEKTLSHYFAGKGFSGFQPWGGFILLADNYFIYKIDPSAMTSTLRQGQVGGEVLAIGRQVLFTGSSYDYSVGSGLVVKLVLDPSRGWDDHVSQDLFIQGHQVLDILASENDLWFLLSEAVVRYEKSDESMRSYRTSTEAFTSGGAKSAAYQEEATPWPYR